MTTTIACLIAGISTTAFITLWFCVVYRELKNMKNAMESARCQLTCSRQQFMRARDSLEMEKTQEILVRSRDIYRQSVVLYNKKLKKPWNHIPGLFMGFKIMKNE